LCRCGVISKLEVLGFVGGFCEVVEESIECPEPCDPETGIYNEWGRLHRK
jgi:hypothetical protein